MNAADAPRLRRVSIATARAGRWRSALAFALLVVSCAIGEPGAAPTGDDDPVEVVGRPSGDEVSVESSDVVAEAAPPVAGDAARVGADPVDTTEGDAVAQEGGAAGAADTDAGLTQSDDEDVFVRVAPAPAFGVLAPDAAESPTMRRIASPLPWTTPVAWFVLPDDAAAQRVASLARRTERRAFEGAPPSIPHSSTFGLGSRTCTECHEQGMAIGRKVAHPMSHPNMTQCLQCHVELHNPLFDLPAPIENGFTALASGPREERRESGPPPLIPHGMSMRGRCLSCHGEFGYAGLQTSHPRRAQCTQCHTASGLVGRPWATGDMPLR